MTVMPNEDIHPELRRAARFIPRFTIQPWALPLVRTLTGLRKPSDVGVEVLTLPSGAGVRLHRPADSVSLTPALLWIHGGGYLFGTAAQDDDVCRKYVQRLGVTVAAVDYQLAPEHPYPIPLEDCYSVLTWLARLPGIDPDRIAIGGASAGGGLTAALALLARDRAEVSPVLQVLSYPMLDDRQPADRHPFTGEYGWRHDFDRFGWTCILGHEPGGPDVSPHAAAARADNLEGLPPAFIGVGALDLFMEANLDYARRLTRAGVPVELHLYPGAYHGSDMVADARLTKMHARDQLEALRAAFARTA